LSDQISSLSGQNLSLHFKH